MQFLACVEMSAYFIGSVLILAVLLYLPVSKMVWVLSVRKLQRKAARELLEEEIQGQLNRSRFISIVLVLIFSYLFNTNLGSLLGYG